MVNKKGTCYSSYSGDMAPALMVMNAKVRLESNTGVREASLENLFSGDGKTPLHLKEGEILTHVIIPEGAATGFSIYMKFANRESIDFPIVGTAYWASPENKQYRLAYTAVDRRPIRGHRVEAGLNGKDLSQDSLDAACDVAAKEAKPVKTSVYSPSYKRKVMGLLLKDAVRRAKRRPA